MHGHASRAPTRATAAVVAALLLAACSPGGSAAQGAEVPPLPKLQLRPLAPELQRLCEAGGAAPDEARLRSLLDLGRTAFEPDAADGRLAAQCRRALLAEPDAHHALEELLAHEQAAVRSQAAFALGELASSRSVPPLLLRLKYEQDPGARLWVAATLARLGNGTGLPDVIAAMSAQATAQDAGLQAIEIGKRAGRDPGAQATYASLQEGLRDLHRVWVERGLLPPATADPTPDPALTARLAWRLLALQDFQLRGVDDARFVLARAGRLAVPLLRRAAAAEEPYLRSHSLEVLRDLGPAAADAAADVLPLLGDPLTRVDAARALSSLRGQIAAPHLRAWLTDPDVELRAAAASALGPIGDRSAEPLLEARMRDAKEAMDVRVQAAFSLAVLDLDRPGVRFLRERLAAGDYHEPTLRELLDRLAAFR